MDGNWNGASPNVKNKYQYGDKELQTDFGLNWNDFGARMYDAAIGRFTTADPMADFRSWVSPYQYVQNNPINRIDPTGMIDKGADGMTNEQWMKASNPANNGSQAASTAYNGLKHAQSTYEQKKAENEYAAAHGGATRPVTGDDIAASGSGSNIVWEGYRSGEFNTVTGFHFSCGCPNPPCDNSKLDLSALMLSLTIAGETTAGTAGAGAGAAPVIVIGGIAVTVYINRELLKEKAQDLADEIAKFSNSSGAYQYTLRANTNGYYDDYIYGVPLPVGKKYLNAGDVWKIGEASNGYSRYSQSKLNGWGVSLVREFQGNKAQVLAVQNFKLIMYFMKNGSLPAGNKTFN